MKTPIKPSLMILCSFVLGYIGIFLPGTRIQYQVVDTSQSNAAAPKIITNEGFASVSGDKYGIDALPCDFARFESPPSSLNNDLLFFWHLAGNMLRIGALSFGVLYAVRRKMPLLKFFSLVAILMGGPVVILLTFRPDSQPMCNPNDLYKILSFTPYWPAILVWIAGILLGYSAIRSMGDPNANAVVASYRC